MPNHTKTKKNTATQVQPLGDRVIVRPKSIAPAKSKSGFIIPEGVQKEKPETGVVVAVGPGRTLENGALVKVSVKVGDIVLFSKYGPDEVKMEGETFLVVREDQILAVIK